MGYKHLEITIKKPNSDHQSSHLSVNNPCSLFPEDQLFSRQFRAGMSVVLLPPAAVLTLLEVGGIVLVWAQPAPWPGMLIHTREGLLWLIQSLSWTRRCPRELKWCLWRRKYAGIMLEMPFFCNADTFALWELTNGRGNVHLSWGWGDFFFPRSCDVLGSILRVPICYF